MTVCLSVGPTASTDNQSEQTSLRLFCILAVVVITPVMGDDNTSVSSLNLCILTGRAQKVPRAPFNNMLLHTFLPGGNSWKMWRKTAEKYLCFYGIVAYGLISRAQMTRFLACVVQSVISIDSSNIVIHRSHDLSLPSSPFAQDCLRSGWPLWSLKGSLEVHHGIFICICIFK